jgi:DNA-binding CsgD family transcriptional regulator/archaellum component FlaG (FlaF/FlaG flagellin family)
MWYVPVAALGTAAPANIYIKNYTKQEYNAASQNWSCAQDGSGNMFFANNIGLLEFDGNSWMLYPAPQGSNIRAVAVDNQNRVYTAGYRELGFWERNKYGRLEYHSFKKEVESEFADNEEFWTVLVTPQAVYFHSFTKIVIFEQQKLFVVKNQGFISSISNGGDGIYASVMNRGIFRIDGHTFTPYLVDEKMQNSQVQFVLPVSGGRKIIGTANNGVFVFNGKDLLVWQPGANNSFKKNIVNKGTVLRNGKVVIGTILDGVSIFSADGELEFKASKENGLQNNTVLGILVDADQNIWLTLDSGIDFLSLSPHGAYTIYEHNELGAVYSGAFYGNNFYLATNQGLYKSVGIHHEKPFLLVPGTQGHVWDCKLIDDRLFVSHNSGTFELSRDHLNKISSVSGGFSITQNPQEENSLVQSTYSNLVFFKKTAGHWTIDRVDYQFNELIRYLEIDHLGNYWASHMYRGVYQLRYNGKDSLVMKKYYGKETFGKDHNIHVFKMENRIVFATGEKLYTFDDLHDAIVDYSWVNGVLGNFAAATRIIPAGNHHYWLITKHECGLFQIENTTVKKIKEFPFSLFKNQLITGYENIIPYPGMPSKAILCLENGYALLTTDTTIENRSIAGKKPVLRHLSAGGRNDAPHDMAIDGSKLTLPFHRNNVELQFAFPYYGRESVVFQYFIENLDKEWSGFRDKPLFHINRIPAGKYKVNVKAVNSWGESSDQFTMLLEILPPWYLSVPAYVAYLVIIAGVLLLYRRRIVARTEQKESREKEERERELILLRNEKLQSELSYKVKELASSTMHIIKKNEFLIEIKEILSHQKATLGTRFPDKYYESLVTKIDENMSSQDNWKIFEASFEQAHEQFMKKLRANYPDLTPSDLRLCALLRMNLSSKEIAPLLGISVRGVENHRYRIRKRLNLENDQNLSDFVIGL